jgi:hypothetical protein
MTTWSTSPAAMPIRSRAAAGARTTRRPRLAPSTASKPVPTTIVRWALRIAQTK